MSFWKGHTEEPTYIKCQQKGGKKGLSFPCEIQGGKEVITGQLGIISPVFNQIKDETQPSHGGCAFLSSLLPWSLQPLAHLGGDLQVQVKY